MFIISGWGDSIIESSGFCEVPRSKGRGFSVTGVLRGQGAGRSNNRPLAHFLFSPKAFNTAFLITSTGAFIPVHSSNWNAP